MCRHMEILARGVCIKSGQILLCQTLGAGNTYLPGGHVEMFERAKDALVREIKEEMGVDSLCGGFLGAAEHSFVQRDGRHCEINLIFALDIPDLSPDRAVKSEESHIEFMWIPMAELGGSNLEPIVLREKLNVWLGGGREEHWASTY